MFWSSCSLRRPQKMMKSSPSIWHLLHNVKFTLKISSIFVAFLENMNFNGKCMKTYWQPCRQTKVHLYYLLGLLFQVVCRPTIFLQKNVHVIPLHNGRNFTFCPIIIRHLPFKPIESWLHCYKNDSLGHRVWIEVPTV